jgi:hypothetical protein
MWRGFVLQALDVSKQHVWPGRHREENREARTSVTTESKPDRTVSLAEAIGCTGMWLNNSRKTLDEDSTLAPGL